MGEIDGISIILQSLSYVHRPAKSYCGEGYFAFSAQRFVDVIYRFIAISDFIRRATQDSNALEMSNKGHFCTSGNILQCYWVAGYDAYSVEGCLMTPFRKSILNLQTDS